MILQGGFGVQADRMNDLRQVARLQVDPLTDLRDCEQREDRNGSRMNKIPPAVLGLLIANIVVFAAGFLLPEVREQIVEVGALWFPDNGHFGLWQEVTYMFLHGGLGHIFFNMFALISFGKILEMEWGATRFLIFYFVCGVGAALIQTGINWYEFQGLYDQLIAKGLTPSVLSELMAQCAYLPSEPATRKMVEIFASPMLGASGAIYGVLVAFGLRHPNAKLALMFVPVPVAAKYFIPGLLLLDLLSGVTGFSLFGGNIAHFAHLGGALIGFLLMLLWRKRSQGAVPVGQTFR